MDAEELAKAVAKEYGDQIEKVVALNISGIKQRSFGLSDSVVLAAFIVQCAQLAVQLYSMKKDIKVIKSELDEEARNIKDLKAEVAKSVVSTTIARIPPTNPPDSTVNH